MRYDGRVLVAENGQGSLSDVYERLMECGVRQVDAALSQKEAIELIESERYDIVFIDCRESSDYATQLISDIRALNYKNIFLPIIACANSTSEEMNDFFIGAFIKDVLKEPINGQNLDGILQKWLPDEKISVSRRTVPPLNPTLSAISKINGMNVKQALIRFGGMPKILEKSMRRVSSSLDGRLDTLKQYLEQENIKMFTVDVHGLKGSFSNIGAVNLAVCAEALEAAGKLENISYCKEHFSSFEDDAKSLACEIRAILNI